MQAAVALGRLALDDADNKVKIADAGAIELLAELGRSGSKPAKEYAAWALANLAASAENKDKIADAGGIGLLVEQLRGGSEEAKERAAKSLWVLATDGDNQLQIALAGGIGPLVMRNPTFLIFMLVNGHLLTLYLHATAARALYSAARGAPVGLWMPYLTELALGFEVMAMYFTVANVGLVPYARYLAWRAVPPALCTAGVSIGTSTLVAAAVVVVVVGYFGYWLPNSSFLRSHGGRYGQEAKGGVKRV